MNSLRLEAQITGCQCACNHCLTLGHHDNFNMNIKDIEYILKNMNECCSNNFLFPLYDVTNHPIFIKILELSNTYGQKRNILSTNGTHIFTHDEFQAMKDMGIVDLQLAFHGIYDTHDKFVHHKGAYDSLLSLINSAGKFGFKFWIILFIHKNNVSEIQKLVNILKSIDYIRDKDFAISTYQYFGRAMNLTNLQFTKEEFERLECKDSILPKRRFTESEWLKIVKEDETWNKPAFVFNDLDWALHMDKNFNVFFDVFSPSYLCLPGAEQGLRLGNLRTQTLKEIIEHTREQRPPYIKALESITIPELADVVGMESNLLYTHNDIPQYKWPYEYLKKLHVKSV